MSLQTYLQEIITEHQTNKHPFWAFNDIDIQGISLISKEIRNKFKNLFIVGTGASVTNARALLAILPKPIFNIKFLDNIDFTSINNCLERLKAEDAAILVISKSGDTSETLAILDYLIQSNFVSNNLYIITEDKVSPLKHIGLEYNATFIDHAKNIGGRFAILTEVGLLPASIAGVDIEALIKTCLTTLSQFLQNESEVVKEAEWILGNYNQGKKCYVMMHYGDQLSGLYEWIRQMYAESLGKSNFGFTLIIARGTIDQHSQIQLYLDGPDDKFFSMIYLNQNPNNGLKAAEASLNKLMHIHANAAYKGLLERKRSVNFTEANDIYHHIASSIIITMLNIILIAKSKQFNAFDQPAVEVYKKYVKGF